MFGKEKNKEQAPENKMMKGFLQATKYLNEHLNPGETPIYRAHLSWIPCFIHQIPFMLVGGIAGGVAWGITTDFFLGTAVFAGAWVLGVLSQLPQCYKNISTDILITNQGIHSKKKLFAVEDDQFSRYGYINDAELTYGTVFQRMFQYGQIKVSTVGGGGESNYEFKNLAKPATFKNALRAAQQKFGGGGGYAGGMPPQGGPQQAPIPQNQGYQDTGISGGGGIPTRHRNS